jgi:GT2 family glycosyltransferase
VNIGFVVLTWNHVEFLKRCLRSLIRTVPNDSKILIVDNGSTDLEAQRFVRNVPSSIPTLLLPNNIGYAAGMNSGLNKMLYEPHKLDAIALVNNDVVFSKNWYPKIVEFMEKFDNNIVASPQQSPCIPYMDEVTSHLEIEDNWNKWNIFADSVSHPKMELGSWFFSPIIPVKILLDVGLLDEEFGTTHEDCDYVLRVEKSGRHCYTTNSSVVYHYRGISTATLNKTVGEGYWHKARAHFEDKWKVKLGDAKCYRSIFWKDEDGGGRVI